MSEQDEQWFDALAGHRAPATAQDARLHQALRQAASYDAGPQRDELAQQRLVRRLEAEGLLPVARTSRLRNLRPRLAQVAVIVLCVGVVLQLVPTPLTQDGPKVLLEETLSEPELAGQRMQSFADSAPAEQSFAKPAPARERQGEGAPAAPPAAGASQRAESLIKRRSPAAAADRAKTAPSASSQPDLRIVLQLADEDVAKARLQQLVRDDADIKQLAVAEQESNMLRLRCDTPAACEDLYQLLHELDATALDQPLPVKRSLSVILQVRP